MCSANIAKGVNQPARKAVQTPKAANKSTLRRARQTPNRKLAAADGPIVNLLQLPRVLITPFLLGQNALVAAGASGAQQAQQDLGHVMDRTRTVADAGFNNFENIAAGVAQRTRGYLDRVTARAADIVDHSVALGTNSIGAGFEAARGLHSEANKMADQAASVATGAMKVGEAALNGAVDRFNSVAQQGGPVLGMVVTPLGGIVQQMMQKVGA